MAKVATGQKLDRLPAGKIFGMSVTEPKSLMNRDEDVDVSTSIDGISEELKHFPRVSTNDVLPSRSQKCFVCIK
jgi:hypothetical protein